METGLSLWTTTFLSLVLILLHLPLPIVVAYVSQAIILGARVFLQMLLRELGVWALPVLQPHLMAVFSEKFSVCMLPNTKYMYAKLIVKDMCSAYFKYSFPFLKYTKVTSGQEPNHLAGLFTRGKPHLKHHNWCIGTQAQNILWDVVFSVQEKHWFSFPELLHMVYIEEHRIKH